MSEVERRRSALRGVLIALLAIVPLGVQSADGGIAVPLGPGSRSPVGSADSIDSGFRCSGCNVVLVSIDTLRPDRLGCYGHGRETSPNLDRLCDESVVFTEAIAQATSTLPSHASLLTSLIPPHHGARHSGRKPLVEGHLTVTEILDAMGYATAAFTGAGQVASIWGLDQGFDLYVGDSRWAELQAPFRETVDRAIEWLETTEPNRYFLFLHTYEVHHPYAPEPSYLYSFFRGGERFVPEPTDIRELQGLLGENAVLDERRRREILLNYDGEIRSVDDGIGRLVDYLDGRRDGERTLVVITSDHGEEFGEHGTMGWHSHTLYDELLRVPLIVRFPGAAFAGVRVPRQVRLIDVAPTILDVLDVDLETPFQGVSLVPTILGRDPDVRYAVAMKDDWKERYPLAIRTERWKLYDERLFDLLVDPGETRDVSDRHPIVVEWLRRTLERIVESRPAEPGESIELPEELVEQLRSLGYVR